MAEQFLVRGAPEGEQRFVEVHALHESEDVEPASTPVIRVVDATDWLRKFTEVDIKGGLNRADTDTVIDDKGSIPDVILNATEAAAAVVEFFSRHPDNSLAYYIPDENMHHLPTQMVDGLPGPIATDIRRVTGQADEIKLPEYDPRGPYL